MWSSAVCALLIVALGSNLLMRHTLGQCDFDPDETCGGSGDRDNAGSSPKSGKDCSYACVALEIAGIIVLIIGFLPLSYIVGIRLWRWVHQPADSGSKESKRKVGCDCCYCMC